jgi:polygalacturonase
VGVSRRHPAAHQAAGLAARDFSVSQFGGKPDGMTDATTAFQQAIARCHAEGGGRVSSRRVCFSPARFGSCPV